MNVSVCTGFSFPTRTYFQRTCGKKKERAKTNILRGPISVCSFIGFACHAVGLSLEVVLLSFGPKTSPTVVRASI